MKTAESVSNPSPTAVDFVDQNREVIISADNVSEAAEQISAILGEAGLDPKDCIYSGHADSDLRAKEETDFDESGHPMPDEAPDDALLFWFGDSLLEEETSNPLWYAFKSADDHDEDPRLDVFSKSILTSTVPASLLNLPNSDIGEAWLTEEELDHARVYRFIIKRQ